MVDTVRGGFPSELCYSCMVGGSRDVLYVYVSVLVVERIDRAPYQVQCECWVGGCVVSNLLYLSM